MKVSCVGSAPKAAVVARAQRHVAKAPAAPAPAPRREAVLLRSTLAPGARAPAHCRSAQPAAAAALAHPSRRPRPVAVLAGINPFVSFLQGQADTFKGLNLPEPLIHWGARGAARTPARGATRRPPLNSLLTHNFSP